MKTKLVLIAAILLVSISCKKDEPRVANAFPTEGLISYVNFENNFKDQYDFLNDGNPFGNPTFDAGKIGSSVVLNGTNQYFAFVPKLSKTLTSISVSCWIKTNQINGVYTILDAHDFRLKTSLTSLQIEIVNAQSQVDAAITSFTANQWIHVVGTYDGTTIKLYYIGVLASTKALSGPMSWQSQDVFFGVGGFSQNYWAGSIDELYIYNRALSQAEVTQLYNLK